MCSGYVLYNVVDAFWICPGHVWSFYVYVLDMSGQSWMFLDIVARCRQSQSQSQSRVKVPSNKLQENVFSSSPRRSVATPGPRQACQRAPKVFLPVPPVARRRGAVVLTELPHHMQFRPYPPCGVMAQKGDVQAGKTTTAASQLQRVAAM